MIYRWCSFRSITAYRTMQKRSAVKTIAEQRKNMQRMIRWYTQALASKSWDLRSLIQSVKFVVPKEMLRKIGRTVVETYWFCNSTWCFPIGGIINYVSKIQLSVFNNRLTWNIVYNQEEIEVLFLVIILLSGLYPLFLLLMFWR